MPEKADFYAHLIEEVRVKYDAHLIEEMRIVFGKSPTSACCVNSAVNRNFK